MNMRLLEKDFRNDRRITLVESGLSKETGNLYFYERGSSSYLTDKEHSNSIVKISAVDDMPECRNATYIKMDIEGAEMDALKGAKEIIKRNRPTLGICIYHSDEDMIQIAEWVHELVPEYKLYVRQHTRRDHETVLYAVI